MILCVGTFYLIELVEGRANFIERIGAIIATYDGW